MTRKSIDRILTFTPWWLCAYGTVYALYRITLIVERLL